MDNAFEKARAAYGTGAYDDATLEFLFPQLKESEDERIRKHIIDIIRDNAKSKRIPCDAEIAYLKKLKEQKPLSTEETELNSIAFLEQMGYTCIPPGKEQRIAEWSEDWREEDIQTRFAFYTYKDDPSVLYLSNVFVEETSRNHGFGTRILRAAEKVAEVIGAITIRLKVKQDSPANAWYRNHGYGYMAFEDGYDWLEKTLEYMKPSKSEWSEEDKNKFDLLHTCVCRCITDPYWDYSKREKALKELIPFIERLESLKNRGNSSKSNTNSLWKPSEEQMEALMLAIEGKCPPTSYMSRRLEDLYEELRKLT